MNMILYKWLSIVSKYLWVILLVSRALSKGSLKLFSDGLILLLLSNKFILQPVNLFLEFLNCSLSKLSSGLRLLQLGSQRLDLLLVAGLPFIGLLLRDFKRLQVAGNNSQLLLKLNDLHLASLCSLLSSLKLTLNLLQSLGNLIVLLVSFLSLVSGILEFLLKLAHSFLILDSPVLHGDHQVLEAGHLEAAHAGHRAQSVEAGLALASGDLEAARPVWSPEHPHSRITESTLRAWTATGAET